MIFPANHLRLLSGSEDIMDYIKINDSENAIFDEHAQIMYVYVCIYVYMYI